MDIVTLAQVKSHLRVDNDLEDDDLALKLLAAQSAVLTYLKSSSVDTLMDGSPSEFQFAISAATLLMVGYLYRNRDGDEDQAFDGNYLPGPVKSLLLPYRTPSFA